MECTENCGCKKTYERNEKDIQRLWDAVEAIPAKIEAVVEKECSPLKKAASKYSYLAISTIVTIVVALSIYLITKG